jgi:hypothetical protein
MVGDFVGTSEKYCKYCSDEEGNLRPRQEVQQGIAKWVQSWQEGISEEQAMTRADFFMKAMPAWADETRIRK